jgi:hypothetical protein
VAQACAEVMIEKKNHNVFFDNLTWEKRLEDFISPNDYDRFFHLFNATRAQFTNSSWLGTRSRLPYCEGGINLPLGELRTTLRKKFDGIPHFRAWINEKDAPDLSFREIVMSWQSSKDALDYFNTLNIPNELWRKTSWLEMQSRLPINEGGINFSLSGLYRMIKIRFKIFRNFLAWMDGHENPKLTWTERVKSWNNPKDALQYFAELNILEKQWRSSSWLKYKARLSFEEGGINLPLTVLVRAISKEFGSFKKFLAWIDGSTADETKTYVDIVYSWKSPKDALTYFSELNVVNEEWKNSNWFIAKSKLDTAQGGIGLQLTGLYQAIKKRYTSFKDFLIWMDPKSKPEIKQIDIVRSWNSPNDALAYFKKMNIPSDKWRSHHWLSTKAQLSNAQGGIETSLNGLIHGIRKRFKSFKIFLTWMDSHIPIQGFTSSQQAQEYLHQEILRLRISNKWIQKSSDEPISQEEIDTILSKKWVKKSGVARAVVDYLNSLSEDE